MLHALSLPSAARCALDCTCVMIAPPFFTYTHMHTCAHTHKASSGLFAGIKFFAPANGASSSTFSSPPLPTLKPSPPPPSIVKPASSPPNGPSSSVSSSSSPPLSSSEQDGDYLQQLSSLNHSVRDWIDKHVTENPYVDLTPVFRDYEAHLNTIGQWTC